MNRQTWPSIVVAILIFSLTGCGGGGKDGKTSELSGKVTFNGDTLRYGQVTIYDEKDQILITANIIEGEYKATALPSGTVKLIVQTVGPYGEAVGFEPASPPIKNAKPLPPDVKKAKIKELPETAQKAIESLTPIPLKYGAVKTSGLSTTLDGTAKVYDIALTGKGERPKAPPPPK